MVTVIVASFILWCFVCRIYHTVVLDDPFDDPPGLEDHIPDQSPQLTREQLDVSHTCFHSACYSGNYDSVLVDIFIHMQLVLLCTVELVTSNIKRNLESTSVTLKNSTNTVIDFYKKRFC